MNSIEMFLVILFMYKPRIQASSMADSCKLQCYVAIAIFLAIWTCVEI